MKIMMENLWNGPSIGRYTRAIDHYRASTEEHIRILRAISEGDSGTARSVMEQHLNRSMNNMLEGFPEAE